MKQYRNTVFKFLTVPDGLGHSLRHVQPLHPLDLRVNAGDVHHIRGSSIGNSLPRLCVYPVGLENPYDFQFTVSAFFL